MLEQHPEQPLAGKRGALFELKFATRIALLFGALGLLALLVSMAYSVRTAEQSLEAEIQGALQQRHRTIVNLIETRLGLLDVYLQSAAANRIFTSLVNEPEVNTQGIDLMVEDMAFMFQDSALGANLDLFYIVDPAGNLVFDAGSPLYTTSTFISELRAPLHYANHWSLVNTQHLTAIIKSVPIFDPATIQLRGYMFVGLAIGQNRSFIEEIAGRADVDIFKVGINDGVLIRYAGVDFATTVNRHAPLNQVVVINDVNLLRSPIFLGANNDSLWAEVGISNDRFPSITESYQQLFFLLSGGFLFFLIVAAWLVHLSHNRSVGQLMQYIKAIKTGDRSRQYSPGGIIEYNQVGFAMQEMVHDLNIAATVFESAEGMMVTDQFRTILRVNEGFTDITGYTPEEAIGQPLDFIKSERHEANYFEQIEQTLNVNGSWQGEIWNQRKDGQEYLQWTSITAVRSEDDSTIINYVVTLIDATQRKAAETKITQLAFYDQLTGLPNRQLLMDRLEKALTSGERHENSGAILYIDLDDFKTLNDTRGHDVGDQLLKQVANRLLGCVRRNDTVARIGGDEFIILLEDLDPDIEVASQQAEIMSEKILEALPQPYYIAGIEQFSTLSIGLTLFQGEKESVDELLKQADLAMYQAKAAGRNTRRFFNPTMQARVLEHAALANDIRKGMQNDEFVLFFQPQVDQQHQLIGAEVLLRWNHPTRGITTPGEIIPVAEETGLILPLGEWVLKSACQVLADWAKDSITAQLTLSVNISARQLHQADFVEQVKSIIAETGANAQKLKLELTESMLLHDVEDTIHKMHKLRDHGVSFSLDDFGTGYSSLSYLKQLPLDQLKIDQSFVRDLAFDNQDSNIARTIVSLANGLGISVIAEGVETPAQCERLEVYGCNEYQGYLFGRPVRLKDMRMN
ncbi:EAL domain-containing protein [Salinispirillum sp. LH 10-3-1]|uniref:cyclic-guanylate-specific phosphodiesterase n=1 Tax=Salinispirillum sp. LH 10-3-1 TaxID=2952525 RepID=A0AB38YB99_9GAMM